MLIVGARDGAGVAGVDAMAGLASHTLATVVVGASVVVGATVALAGVDVVVGAVLNLFG